MNIKLILALIATLISTASFAVYIKDTFRGTTQPHSYTWLIWLLTQGTATAALWYGGGGIGALDLTVSTGLIFCLFLLSLRFGSKNITRSDTVVLLIALSAMGVWWLFDTPLISVLMVCAIDLIGYAPSIRKSYEEPWSESILSWVGFTVSNIFAIGALEAYNSLTLSYLVAMVLANAAMVGICVVRRRTIVD